MSDKGIASRLAQVSERVARACRAAGRPEGAVELVAVSKLQPPEAIREAYRAGQRAFGENYAQELRDKAAALADLPKLRWHAIGPLQTNKARTVASVAQVFHALDRREVARELSRRRSGAPLRCLIEVNVAGEATKRGVAAEEARKLLDEVRGLPNLEVAGLMCLPPLEDDPERSRPHFRALAALARSLGLSELSMGTTADFEVAISEGATMVRVGTAIFGERPD
ncbi:MAG: YggS family pyridoxal phosphate-dependent enzyme [Myxococcales bacterium]|nr:YggS family pyridoxal phosphate-dependent enzyme [Myxococcales bacterium]